MQIQDTNKPTSEDKIDKVASAVDGVEASAACHPFGSPAALAQEAASQVSFKSPVFNFTVGESLGVPSMMRNQQNAKNPVSTFSKTRVYIEVASDSDSRNAILSAA